MNIGTIGGFMARNGKSILKKSALAIGVIAGLAFLMDRPEELEEAFVVAAEETERELLEEESTSDVEVTEEVD